MTDRHTHLGLLEGTTLMVLLESPDNLFIMGILEKIEPFPTNGLLPE